MYTEHPPTKKDQVIAWTVFGGICLVSVAPLIMVGLDEVKYRREERRKRKADAKFIKDMQEKI
jgi:hypothetical protein